MPEKAALMPINFAPDPGPPEEDKWWMLELHDGRCAYCLRPLEPGFHWDHVLPIKHGGQDVLANLVPSCPSCNLSKGHKLVHEWLAQRMTGGNRDKGRSSESKSAWAKSEAGRRSGRARTARRRARIARAARLAEHEDGAEAR